MSHPLDERNALIVEAYKLGATRDQIAEMAQLTPQRVGAILKKLVPDYSFKRGKYNKTREPRYDSIEADVLWAQAGVQF